ncbi:hypothetical protein OIDMADRAFT_16588 [Oidiodendron maius Zn]|uniref:Extracellular membrane protein CFEM domain-containing protein n=1 Tax=Oidiodendron maius (strain Zn) TaxID=913774 RepID=A0A0C3E1Y3_OIDMZ|nr:hypothetical protein OIDMADRAFT_16588 [Oidiodendron maius Zn]
MRLSTITFFSIVSSVLAAPADVALLEAKRTIAFPECAAACTLFCLTHGDAACYAACLAICLATVEPGTPINSVEANGAGLSFDTDKGKFAGSAW